MTGSARITTDQSADGLRIEIPRKKSIWGIIASGIFLLFIGVFVYGMLTLIVSDENVLIRWFGIGLTILAEAVFVRKFGWLVAGKEVILAKHGTLTVRREAFGSGRSWDYDGARIRSLRVLPRVRISADVDVWQQITGTERRGRIAFNYRSEIITFGADVEEDEAHEILNQLKPSYPE